MAQEKKGLFQRWGESLKKKRSWTLLPAQVVMQAAAVGQAVNAVAKESAILANLGLTGLFALLFAWRPKEVVYFVALCLAVLLQLSLLLVNLMV